MGKIDLVIRGGTIADGTGGDLREADIAVNEGRIVEVGKFTDTGHEEVDARGLLVTPGFIDVHTHYDGQLTWSDQLNPSSDHGVTTVVAGNCGVGFAPCRDGDRDNLIRLMEGVEDIPELVMSDGLPWDWKSFPDFLDSIESKPHDIDFAMLFPHSPLRVFVMGNRALDLEPATDADKARMRQLTREAVEAGAIGFGTSRSIFHKASDGGLIPSVSAEISELVDIAGGLADAGRGTFQAVTSSRTPSVDDYLLFHEVARQSGRPLTYTLLQFNAPHMADIWKQVMDAVERDRAEGLDIRPQVFNRPVGNILGLDASFNPFCMHPYYVEHLAHLSFEDRVAEMRKPEVRAKLIKPQGEMKLAHRGTLRQFGEMYPMGEFADYEPDPSTSVEATAKARGITPDEVAYDLLLERDGRGKLLMALSNFAAGNLDATLDLMKRQETVLALGDGGAHYGVICDATYSTYTLTHWARDRKRERLDIPTAVKMLTDQPARLHRFRDRGRIAPGMKADINVIDMDRLKLYSPTVVHDLPGGGKRLTQKADGYVATFVGGTAIRRNGTDTGARPGRLVRDAGI